MSAKYLTIPDCSFVRRNVSQDLGRGKANYSPSLVWVCLTQKVNSG